MKTLLLVINGEIHESNREYYGLEETYHEIKPDDITCYKVAMFLLDDKPYNFFKVEFHFISPTGPIIIDEIVIDNALFRNIFVHPITKEHISEKEFNNLVKIVFYLRKSVDSDIKKD